MIYSNECSVEAAACRTAETGLQYAWTGEVACRRRQPCEASSGEVDMGLLWGRQPRWVPLKTGSVNARVYRDLLHRWLLPCFVFLPF